MENNRVAHSGTRLLELLTGRYIRTTNYRTLFGGMPSENPMYWDQYDLAILLRWESRSEKAIDAKAKDVRKHLADAVEQLPAERPCIVHVCVEAVEGDAVEKRRFNKIFDTAHSFDPAGKKLEFVYCHYFVPESPTDRPWAFDETIQYFGRREASPLKEEEQFLVIPNTVEMRSGPHWEP